MLNKKCEKCGKVIEVISENRIMLNHTPHMLQKYRCGHFGKRLIVELRFTESNRSAADECAFIEYLNQKNYESAEVLSAEAIREIESERLRAERDEKWEMAFPYQREGVKRIEASNYNHLNADEMGLGKTIQALLALRYNIHALTPTLIVCPASLQFNWGKELATWILNDMFPFKDAEGNLNFENAPWVPIIHTDGNLPLWPGAKIYIVSQDLLHKPKVAASIKAIGFKLFIGDEIHKFANTASKRTIGLLEVIEEIPHRIALSGTPIKNKFTEYFIPLHLVRPEHWPTRQTLNRYAEYGYGRVLGLAPHMTRAFFEKTTEYVTRRKKADVLKDLPPIRRNFRTVQSGTHKKFVDAYNELQERLEKLIEDKKSAAIHTVEILGIMSQMRHVTGLMKIEHAAEFLMDFIDSTAENGEEVSAFENPEDESAIRRKIASLEVLAKRPGTPEEGEVARAQAIKLSKKYGIESEFYKPKLHGADEKITIGCHHQDVINYFANFVSQLGAEALVMTGKNNAYEKQEIEEEFRHPEKRYLVASILACGEGRNLQFCPNALIVEREWNPANEEQFELRFSRPLKCPNDGSVYEKQGDGFYKCRKCGKEHYQTSVNITYLLAKDTIDEFFHEMVEMKRAIKSQVLDKNWSIENDPNMILELAYKVTMKRLKYTGGR